MPAFKTYKFRDLAEMEYFLNGGILSGKNPAAGYSGIVGKTLVFSQPSATTVTFTTTNSQVDPSALTFAEVRTQIQAALAAVKVKQKDGKLLLIEASPSNGVTVTSAGTANAILGFDKGNSTVGRVYKYPDGVTAAATPHWVQAYAVDGYHVLVVRE